MDDEFKNMIDKYSENLSDKFDEDTYKLLIYFFFIYIYFTLLSFYQNSPSLFRRQIFMCQYFTFILYSVYW
jgi:hypothetical protein